MIREASTPVRALAAMIVCAGIVALGSGALDPTGEASASATAHSSIVGGKKADFSQWPFAVTLFYRRHLICGGSVIAPTRVLTAAHCAVGLKVKRMRIVANRPRLRDTSVGERIDVVAKAVHPDYKRTLRHDFAVLTLAHATTAPPVALATPEEDVTASAPGVLLRVAGWGPEIRSPPSSPDS